MSSIAALKAERPSQRVCPETALQISQLLRAEGNKFFSPSFFWVVFLLKIIW